MANPVAAQPSTSFTDRIPRWGLAIGPFILLALVLLVIVATDAGLGDRTTPPIETLNVDQITLPEPDVIELQIINDGPDTITIAQVLVDEAYWQFVMDPSGPLERLDRAAISIPYPWIEGEGHTVSMISSTGVVFNAPIAVAVEAPQADRASVVQFGIVGLFVGVVPVVLGLLWFPVMRSFSRPAMNFILALTVGLLVFLTVDMFEEAREVGLAVAGSFNAPTLVPLVALCTTGLLIVVGRTLRRRRASGNLTLSYQMAFGIGLHNLGEGLAIGGAFALGEVALGVFLVIGFTLHNVTEGVGIAAPLVRERPTFLQFATLAAIAGVPAILGTWIGAFIYSPLWTMLFLAIGIGAIVQVIIEVSRLVARDQAQHEEPFLNWATIGGVVTGIIVMYGTALLVTA